MTALDLAMSNYKDYFMKHILNTKNIIKELPEIKELVELLLGMQYSQAADVFGNHAYFNDKNNNQWPNAYNPRKFLGEYSDFDFIHFFINHELYDDGCPVYAYYHAISDKILGTIQSLDEHRQQYIQEYDERRNKYLIHHYTLDRCYAFRFMDSEEFLAWLRSSPSHAEMCGLEIIISSLEVDTYHANVHLEDCIQFIKSKITLQKKNELRKLLIKEICYDL